jgi:(2Fe-2S) ferredoxin
MRYDFHVFCCTNRRADGVGCCASKGAEELHAHLKKRTKELGIQRVRINKAGCLDACKQGVAVVVYPQGEWHQCTTIEDMDKILEAMQGEQSLNNGAAF